MDVATTFAPLINRLIFDIVLVLVVMCALVYARA